jgi:hypothetical protein
MFENFVWATCHHFYVNPLGFLMAAGELTSGSPFTSLQKEDARAKRA